MPPISERYSPASSTVMFMCRLAASSATSAAFGRLIDMSHPFLWDKLAEKTEIESPCRRSRAGIGLDRIHGCISCHETFAVELFRDASLLDVKDPVGQR